MSKSIKGFILSGLLVTVAVLFAVAVRRSDAASAASPALQSAGDVTACTWLGCKPGAASYSQDDGLTSCRAPLEAAGFRGTFYYDGSSTLSWFAPVSAAGHEVSSHLTNHVLNCTMPPSCYPNCTLADLYQTPYTPQDVTDFRQNQIEPNLNAIEAGTNKPVLSMAYPCGATDAARMIASNYYFLGARSYLDIWSSNFPWVLDINNPTPPEALLLNSDDTFHSTFVDRAISEGKWAIFSMHDTCLGIDYLTSHQNQLWVAPVGDVLKYIRVRNATQISNYSRVGDTINFDAVHTLSTFQRQRVDGSFMTPILFDNAISLRVGLLNTDNVVNVLVNGVSTSFTTMSINNTRYVVFNTPLNLSRHVVINVTAGTPPPTDTATPVPTPTGTTTPLPTNTPTPGPSPTPTATSTPAACPCMLWDDTVVPAEPAVGDVGSLELGVRFQSTTAGYITGLRFYKGSTNTGTHTGQLYTLGGTLLASATFVNETASGWQTVYFGSPVAIAANTPYVASYVAPIGHFAVNRNYFDAAYTRGPLYAFSTTEIAGGNGVYAQPSGFPTLSYSASNYWVDVIFDNSAPALTATPIPTATPLPTNTGTPAPTATPTATATPLPTATPTNTPTPVTCPCTIWDNSVVPAEPAVGDVDSVELGVRFQSTTAGYITGLRFYKGTTNGGTHTGRLWTLDGTLLASAVFINETASGWQSVNFDVPVTIAANTVYVASYQAPQGHFAVTRSYFDAGYTRGPLHAFGMGEIAGGNGVYVYPSGFPAFSYTASNYWVDVIFDTTAPLVTATPTATATPLPTNTPTPTATSTATSTPVPTATATPTATPTATATATPAPTATALPVNTGLLNPSANAPATGGDNNGYQTSPTNAYTSNSLYAVDTNSGTSTSTSCGNTGKDRHVFSNYNLTVPVTATVLGLEVRADARADSTANTPFICIELSSDGGATWTAAKTTANLGTTRVTYTLGGTADTWGRAWTGTNLSNTNFRVRITNVSSSTARDFSLDWLAVRVTYRP